MGRHPQVDSPLHFWISVLNTAVFRKRAVCAVKRALYVVKRALCFEVHFWISVLNTAVCGKKSNELSEEPYMLSKDPYMLSEEAYMLSKEPYALISTARSQCRIQWYAGKKPCLLSKESYGVATISRLLKIIGLFCKRAL